MTVAPAMILLAAGASARFGQQDKLLSPAGGMPLIRRVALALRGGLPDSALIVVVRPQTSHALQDALRDLGCDYVDNAAADEGIASSIRVGLSAVSAEAPGALIAQGDMPNLSADLIARLAATFAESHGHCLVHPVSPSGRQGNPVIWPRDLFCPLMTLAGDQGAKPLLTRYLDRTKTITVAEQALTDLDTREAFEDWRKSAPPYVGDGSTRV